MNPEAKTTFWTYLKDLSANQSPLDFVLIWDNLPRFFAGAALTLEITAMALLLGGLLSIPLAIARAYKIPWFNGPIWCFTYVFRGSPLLVQLYLIYFGLAQFEWVRNSVLWEPVLSNPWWCALIGFTLNTMAYTTEFLRGAIKETPRGEIEAGKACGMTPLSLLRRVILPSAFRRALPAYSNEVIFTLHGSVVLSTLTLQDLLGTARWLNGTYYLAYEGFVTAMMFYMVIVYAITLGFRRWENRWLAHLRQRSTQASHQSPTTIASFPTTG